MAHLLLLPHSLTRPRRLPGELQNPIFILYFAYGLPPPLSIIYVIWECILEIWVFFIPQIWLEIVAKFTLLLVLAGLVLNVCKWGLFCQIKGAKGFLGRKYLGMLHLL